jgi:hypothetical protein
MIKTNFALLFIFCLSTASVYSDENPKVIHVLVALCDNEFQGIVKVPKTLGNGDSTETNLYWGCDGGVRATFHKNPKWTFLKSIKNPSSVILERTVFLHKSSNTLLVADGYRGRYIKNTLDDFFTLLAGRQIENEEEQIPLLNKKIRAGSNASLIVYLGHNGLMDINFDPLPNGRSGKQALVLCCKSQQYFQPILDKYGVKPILLTTQLMYPGAMILEEAFEGWIKGETREQIRIRAGEAYAKNQKISSKSGIGVFSKLSNSP